MHMADALLSPAVGATFWAGTATTIAYCSRKVKTTMDEKIVPLMGVLGAFIFAAQMINFTIPGTGSSGHLGGGLILAAIVGPYAGFLVIASVLVVQALFFADGGILALGCNIWNLGIYPCFIAYPLIFKPLVRGSSSTQRIFAASLLGAVAGLQLGAFSVVLETVLSGRSELPFTTFIYLMQPVHLAIGIVEGMATAGILLFVKNARPEILECTASVRPLPAGISIKKVFVMLAAAALLTGGMLSWFASANPDGLEWSIEKVFGKPELPEQEGGITAALKTLQEKTAFLPDYSFKKVEEESKKEEAGEPEAPWPAVEAGTSVAGIIGGIMVLSLVLLIGFILKAINRNKTPSKKMFLAALLSLFITGASAQAAFLPELSAEDFATTDHFSNNLWGLHNKLEEKLGLSFEIVYLQDMFWNTHSGLNTQDSGEYPRLFGMYLELDTGKAGLWENGAFFLGFEHHSGHSPSERQVGDYQVLSNIDAPRFNHVSEFWYRHTFLNDKLWIKLGKMEANADFSYNETGLEFINSSAGLIPTVPIPSYPDQDWGTVIGIKPADWFSCNVGVYQGKINGGRSIGNTLDHLRGPMLIVEPSFKYMLGEMHGSVNIGTWWNGRRFEAYHKHPSDKDTYSKAWGFYGFWQQMLWKENPADEKCPQGIGLFAQYGWAPKDRSEVEDYVGGGLRWQGALPTRDDDVMGVGVFNAYFSDRAGHKGHPETAIELFYKTQLTGWIAIQPDMQYIKNPGGDIKKNALVLGCRVEFVF